MSKCRINYKINDNEFNTLGIYKDNKLTFMEDDIKFNVTFKEDCLELNRENSEYKINLIIGSNSSCTYELKDVMYKKMSMNVETKSLEISNNTIKAKYKLEGTLFNLNLTYEVIE